MGILFSIKWESLKTEITRTLRPTHLTPSEQYTHVCLWVLLNSPLLIGCDLTKIDAFTLSLLTNHEVIAINQDPLGKQADVISESGTEYYRKKIREEQIWVKPLGDGSKAVGLFNLGDEPKEITLNWADMGICGDQIIRDVWRQADLGKFNNSFSTTVLPHGVVLLKVTNKKSGNN
jgi:alpha-galactosidase